MLIKDFSRASKGVGFIPSFNNNRSLPDSEQLVVYIKPMTNAMQNKYDEKIVVRFTGKKKDQYKSNNAEVNKMIWSECVMGFDNAQVEDVTTKEVKSITPAEAYELFPPELIKEIFEAIQDRSTLDEGLKKP